MTCTLENGYCSVERILALTCSHKKHVVGEVGVCYFECRLRNNVPVCCEKEIGTVVPAVNSVRFAAAANLKRGRAQGLELFVLASGLNFARHTTTRPLCTACMLMLDANNFFATHTSAALETNEHWRWYLCGVLQATCNLAEFRKGTSAKIDQQDRYQNFLLITRNRAKVSSLSPCTASPPRRRRDSSLDRARCISF